MITRVRLLNFQAHADTSLELGEGVTTLVGPTDAGKSSVVRALGWVAFNRPLGEEFIRKGTTQAEVRVWAGGRKIRRVRGGTNNYYAIDGEKFHAAGKNVPEDVQNLLNVGNDNFQRQHDPLFWVGQSPAEVARHLNRVVNLELIDHALSQAQKAARDAKTRLELTEERLKKAEREKQALAWTEKIHARLTRAEELAREAGQKARRRERAASLLASYAEARRVAQRGSWASQKADELQAALDRLEAVQHQVDAARTTLESISRLNKTARKVDYSCLEALIERHREAEARCLRAGALLEERRQILTKVRGARKEEKRLKALLSSLPCPACGRPLP